MSLRLRSYTSCLVTRVRSTRYAALCDFDASRPCRNRIVEILCGSKEKDLLSVSSFCEEVRKHSVKLAALPMRTGGPVPLADRLYACSVRK